MFVNMSLLHFAVATVTMTRGLFEKTEGGEVALVSDRRESSSLCCDTEWERTSAVDIFLNLTTKKQNNFSYIKKKMSPIAYAKILDGEKIRERATKSAKNKNIESEW